MTVNKSQGQTLGIVGLDLRTPAFTHGQLYVAMSRVTDVHTNLTVLSSSPTGCITSNVVVISRAFTRHQHMTFYIHIANISLVLFIYIKHVVLYVITFVILRMLP